ncbi:MAG: dienelactone hydrolase family protein [Anaerolineae bacterium]|nr:dienelactone hydrolase family protein [Gloeobacterales cyanobacterium ES-bin-313]
MKELSRRGFVMTGLATGFALAVMPIAEATITTDSQGLTVKEVKIPVKDGTIPGYMAMPERGTNFPVVLVVQEIFGVQEHLKDICRRFAKLGYLAIAPELYARQGDVSKLKEINDVLKVVVKVPDTQVMSDLDAAVDFAGKSKGDIARLGITGFCWGGRIVWLYSAHNPKVKAGAAWYGRLIGQGTELQPKNPIDLVKELKVPVLGLYGGADSGISVESVDKMHAAVREMGNPSILVVYPETPHGFYADYRPSYREQEAKDGFARLLAWFKTYGVA